ncbi:TraB/GumN family protein [Haliangium sp.]|uniref:TraB/GumN family protein n=1 Tax=Haliangium sp. TaxID=2663208 RepID=UPI003D0C2897
MSTAIPESDTVTVLEQGDRTIYLVGTAHVSDASVAEVREIIERVRPDVVCIELCKARYDALTRDDAWKNLDIFKVIREGKMLFLLANLAIGAYQRRIGDELGVKPGAELLAAAHKADEVGARIELIDRDIHVTLKRTWANLGFWDKMGLVGAIMGSLFSREQVSASDIENLKSQANLSDMLAEFAKEMPAVKGPLIDERDQYLISGVERAEGETVVVVVGAAHVPGMREHYGKPVDRTALDRIPPPSRLIKALKWVIPTVIIAALINGIWNKHDTSVEELLYAWILPNSLMAMLFTAAALARPLSILAAFVASPITSLVPVVGAGMVVGLLEAWLRKPKVEDCERINEDVQSWRGIYRNPVTRVLLVAVAATLGSALGAWIGVSWIIALFA